MGVQPNGVLKWGSCMFNLNCYTVLGSVIRLLIWLFLSNPSFAVTGVISVIVAWFILPEVMRQTPAEIDEL